MEQKWTEVVSQYRAPIGDYNVRVEFSDAFYAWTWVASSINELRTDANAVSLGRGEKGSGRFGSPEDAKADVLAWLDDEAKKEFD